MLTCDKQVQFLTHWLQVCCDHTQQLTLTCVFAVCACRPSRDLQAVAMTLDNHLTTRRAIPSRAFQVNPITALASFWSDFDSFSVHGRCYCVKKHQAVLSRILDPLRVTGMGPSVSVPRASTPGNAGSHTRIAMGSSGDSAGGGNGVRRGSLGNAPPRTTQRKAKGKTQDLSSMTSAQIIKSNAHKLLKTARCKK